MAEDITYLVNIISVFLPIAILLAYFFVNNKLAHSIAGLIASSFIFGFGTYILQNEALNLLGSELFTLFAVGAVFSLLFSQGGLIGRVGGMLGRRGTPPGPGGTPAPAPAPTRTPAPPGTPGGPTAPSNGVLVGVIQDQATNHPILGVAVRVRGTAAHAVTDAYGQFRIELPGLGLLSRMTFRRYQLSFDHPHYQTPPPRSASLRSNEIVDIGTVQLQRRVVAPTNPVSPFILDHLGNPRINNTVHPGDLVTIAFRLAPGLQLAVPLGLTTNPDSFQLEDDTGRRIATITLPNNPANYPPGTNEARIQFRVPTRYPGGPRLPFRDIPVRVLPRIQYV